MRPGRSSDWGVIVVHSPRPSYHKIQLWQKFAGTKVASMSSSCSQSSVTIDTNKKDGGVHAHISNGHGHGGLGWIPTFEEKGLFLEEKRDH